MKPCSYLVCPPVISDAVEKAIAVVHHGSHGPQNCGVAHQTGRQHEVTTTATADTNSTQLQADRKTSLALFNLTVQNLVQKILDHLNLWINGTSFGDRRNSFRKHSMSVYYWIKFPCVLQVHNDITSSDTQFQRDKLDLQIVPFCIEWIHEEFWSGTSLLFGDKIQPKEMPVKTWEQCHKLTWINIRDTHFSAPPINI